MQQGTETTQLLAELIRIPSVNPELDPTGAGEAAIAEFARGWLADRGIEAHLEEVAPGRPNVVAQIGPGGERSIALCAHIDTVSVDGMSIPPYEPRIERGRMYGRGSYDMKCGVAAVMAALATLHQRDIRGRVVLALVADEEYASAGAMHFVRHHPTDACILTEPSEGELILAHKGFLWVDITCHGRAAHGSRWDLGESANAKMSRVVARLDDADREELRRREHPLTSAASMHCGKIEGGSGISTYAASCTAQIERRTLPNEDLRMAFEELRAWVHEVDPQASVELRLERPPLNTSPDCSLARAAREAIVEVKGQAARENGVAYWMDAAIFADAGAETINFGPSGAGAHEAEEWCDLASVTDCADVLVAAVTQYFDG